MFRHARIAVIIFVLIVIFICMPYIIGFYVQRYYQTILNHCLLQSAATASIEHYERGWFRSKAVLNVKITRRDLLDYLPNKKDLLTIHVNQTIYHGPLFLAHAWPDMVGFLFVKSDVESSQEIKAIVERIHLTDFISFLGYCHKKFILQSIHLVYPRTDITMYVDRLRGDLWWRANAKQLKANIYWQQFDFENADATIRFYRGKVYFLSDEKFWRGNDILKIKKVMVMEKGRQTLILENLSFNWSTEVAGNTMDVAKELSIEDIHLMNYHMGPLHLYLSAKKLNATGIDEMVQAYQLIRERGELYQSQLIHKMVMLTPQVFKKGTMISLQPLQLKTEDGDLNLRITALWEAPQETVPDRVIDILSAADIKIDCEISKALVKRWIYFASTLPWFNALPPEVESAYPEVERTMQVHHEFIKDLTQQKLISFQDAQTLLQKQWCSPEEYSDAVRKLLLSKKINLETSHILLYSYKIAYQPLADVKAFLHQHQKQVRDDMWFEVMEAQKAGYLKERNDYFYIQFQQRDSKMWVNGVEMLSP